MTVSFLKVVPVKSHGQQEACQGSPWSERPTQGTGDTRGTNCKIMRHQLDPELWYSIESWHDHLQGIRYNQVDLDYVSMIRNLSDYEYL